MAINVFPTKGNLIAAKKSLALALMGYELLDKKRNILIRELMSYLDKITNLQNSIKTTFGNAYKALEKANVSMGLISAIADTVPEENSISVRMRSVMGVELPVINMEKPEPSFIYGFETTNMVLDEAYIDFLKVKELSVELAEIEETAFRLAEAVKKTQKRANALQNMIIPKYENTIRYISEALEEKDREEFTRLKVIKKRRA